MLPIASSLEQEVDEFPTMDQEIQDVKNTPIKISTEYEEVKDAMKMGEDTIEPTLEFEVLNLFS